MRFSALIQWALISHSAGFTTLPSHGQTSFRIRSTFSTLHSQVDESQFDECLSKADLKGAAKILQSSEINVTKDRFLEIFNAIEERTKEAEENNINKRVAEEGSINLGAMEYPPTSPARTEMTEMYKLLKSTGQLTAYGAAADGKYPALGTKNVTPILLEKITGLSMTSLTPKPTNTLLLAGVALAVLEGIVSVSTGIDLNFMIFATLFMAFLDKLLVNGAVFETATRIFMPEYTDKIRKHEAGHFLCAYLLGCPVEGCVLSTWAALNDARFGGSEPLSMQEHLSLIPIFLTRSMVESH